jgi:hypothetical protein
VIGVSKYLAETGMVASPSACSVPISAVVAARLRAPRTRPRRRPRAA